MSEVLHKKREGREADMLHEDGDEGGTANREGNSEGRRA